MLMVGLTGGIGSGKSAVARRLAERGAVIIDGDALAREVVAPGTDGLAEVVATFGPQVLAPDGSLDRAKLAQLVFGDDSQRRRLEAIVHPRVRERSTRMIAAAAPDAVVVNDIPLLVESGLASPPGDGLPSGARGTPGDGLPSGARGTPGDGLPSRARGSFDLVIIVVASEETRLERLVGKRGMSEEDARARFAAQATDEQRRAVADVVIVNEGTLDELTAQVDEAWEQVILPRIAPA